MLAGARVTRTVNAVSKAKSYSEYLLHLVWVWAVFCYNYVPPQRGWSMLESSEQIGLKAIWCHVTVSKIDFSHCVNTVLMSASGHEWHQSINPSCCGSPSTKRSEPHRLNTSLVSQPFPASRCGRGMVGLSLAKESLSWIILVHRFLSNHWPVRVDVTFSAHVVSEAE